MSASMRGRRERACWLLDSASHCALACQGRQGKSEGAAGKEGGEKRKRDRRERREGSEGGREENGGQGEGEGGGGLWHLFQATSAFTLPD